MLPGSRRGPKPSKWKQGVRASFESFFAKRSEPLTDTPVHVPAPASSLVGLKWVFSGIGADEPLQVCSPVNAPVRSVVLDITGALVALGFGEAPGQGTCERFFVFNEVEVPEDTVGASPGMRGGTGDLQLRLEDGTHAWFSARHCRPWVAEDGLLPPSLKAATDGGPAGELSACEICEPPVLEPVCETLPVSPSGLESVEAARVARQTKHERMRAHLNWVISSSPLLKSQAKLADALSVSTGWLSQYMRGADQRGKALNTLKLNKRHGAILSALKRAQLPIDAATVVAEKVVPNRHSSSQPSSSRTAFTAAPQTAVLTVHLKDVVNCHEGGECHIMALGVPVLGDTRWLMICPGSSGERDLRLRIGLRGRRTLSARSHETLQGRTFEWWLEAIDTRHDIANHGGPLWVARELNSTFGANTRIVGRAELASGGHTGPSSPEHLWHAIARRCGPDAPRLVGVRQTGLIHPSVQALLQVAEEGDSIPSLVPGGFGANTIHGVDGLKGRRFVSDWVTTVRAETTLLSN